MNPSTGIGVGAVGLLVALSLAAIPCAASINHSDTYFVQSRATMGVFIVEEYAGNEAQAERNAADTGSPQGVDAAEAAAYANATQAAMNGTQVPDMRWDGQYMYWSRLNVTVQNMVGPNNKAAFTREFDGSLLLTSDVGVNHTLTVTRPGATSYWNFTVSVPSNWSVTSSSGASIVSQSSDTISLSMNASHTTATVRISELPPAVYIDNAPPSINLGPDRTVAAGALSTFNASVTDNDPSFPGNGSLWWSFVYNGTPVDLSGQSFSFVFWSLGVYSLTFSAVDGSGNRADATLLATVVTPDSQPPLVVVGPDIQVLDGSTVPLNGTASDNDPAFPVGALFWWTLVYNSTLENISGKDTVFLFEIPGTYVVTLWVRDAWGNTGSATRTIVVAPDTQPPLVGAGGDRQVQAGVPVNFTGTASDNDPAFPDGGSFWWTFTYNGTNETWSGQSFSFTFWAPGIYAVQFAAADGSGNIATAFLLLTVVRPDTQPPFVDAGTEISVFSGAVVPLSGAATDNDPAFPGGAVYWWTFEYGGTPRNLPGPDASFIFGAPGTYAVVLWVLDAWGNLGSATRTVIVNLDAEPPAVDAGVDTQAVTGDLVLLNASATDNDPAFQSAGLVWWTFEYKGIYRNLSGKDSNFTFDEPGIYPVTIWALDPSGNLKNDTRMVIVADRSASVADGNIFAWSLLGLALAAIVGITAYRRSARAWTEPELNAEAQAEPTPALPAGPTYVTEGVLLLYKDGRLIHHQASAAEPMFEDAEVVAAMFTAVTDFIRDSLREEAALSRLSYGQNTILLERSAHLFGATIVFGEPDRELRDTLEETLRRIESAYTGVVERWNGDRSAFLGIEEFAAPLFAATAGITRADVVAAAKDRTVKLLSGTEHYKGYLRLRVAVSNQTEEQLKDAVVTVEFNQAALHLARIEPAGLVHEGLTVHLGDVGPGERAGAIYYLDPQTCSQTNIDGRVTYQDASGTRREVAMKRRVAEIVCPLFFTPHQANPATMRRLVETSLHARDSKVYRIVGKKTEAELRDLFALVRDAVQRHHVVLVRNQAARSPFEGRAWFYGQTKKSKSPVIIRASVSEERRTVEFFVAVDSPPTLTGLLAEFNRSFLELVRERAPGLEVEAVLGDALKGLLPADEVAPARSEPRAH